MPLPEPTPENIKQVQEMIKAPDVTPETKAKMDAWLAKATVPGGHTLLPAGNWVERKMAEDSAAAPLTRTEMPEHPSLLGELGKSALAGAVGLGRGITGGLENVDIPSPLDNQHGRDVGNSIRDKVAHGLANEPGETSTETSGRVMSADPLSAAAGGLGSLLVGGLPLLVEKGIARGMGAAGLGAAKSAKFKQTLLGAGRGLGTALGTGAIEDAAAASDLAANDKPVDMSLEGDKMSIRALLGLGGGALGGFLGARAASNRDPLTNAGAGGTAQQMVKLDRMKGGGTGLSGIEVPDKLKPLYAEAMAGGTPIAKGLHEPTIGPPTEVTLAGVDIPESGMRPESMDYLKGGGEAHGGPVRLGVTPDGKVSVIDGRHRISIAREAGEDSIPATVYRYDNEGNVLSTTDSNVPLKNGPVGELFRGEETPAVTREGMAVRDVAAEKALLPVQKGIDETQTGQMVKIREAQARYMNSSAKHQKVEPTEISDVLQKYVKARTFEEGSPLPYANSGEPITELNKLLVVGHTVSSSSAAEAVQRNPGSFRIKLSEARRVGLDVPRGDEWIEGAEPWVVIEPRKVNPEQFESAMQGINKAAAESKVPDALHNDLQQAGFKVRQKFQWPADAGPPPPSVQMTFPEDRGTYSGALDTGQRTKGHTTLNGWAAIQARAHQLMGETEKQLYRIGTNPSEATGETRGADAILNSLRGMGQPGRNRADDALYSLGVNQPGGRDALQNMEAVNLIEGPGGLRAKTEFTGGIFDILRAHNRHAMGLRLDPAMRAAGDKLPRAGAALPLDDRKAIQMLLGIGTK